MHARRSTSRPEEESSQQSPAQSQEKHTQVAAPRPPTPTAAPMPTQPEAERRPKRGRSETESEAGVDSFLHLPQTLEAFPEPSATSRNSTQALPVMYHQSQQALPSAQEQPRQEESRQADNVSLNRGEMRGSTEEDLETRRDQDTVGILGARLLAMTRNAIAANNDTRSLTARLPGQNSRPSVLMGARPPTRRTESARPAARETHLFTSPTRPAQRRGSFEDPDMIPDSDSSPDGSTAGMFAPLPQEPSITLPPLRNVEQRGRQAAPSMSPPSRPEETARAAPGPRQFPRGPSAGPRASKKSTSASAKPATAETRNLPSLSSTGLLNAPPARPTVRPDVPSFVPATVQEPAPRPIGPPIARRPTHHPNRVQDYGTFSHYVIPAPGFTAEGAPSAPPASAPRHNTNHPSYSTPNPHYQQPYAYGAAPQHHLPYNQAPPPGPVPPPPPGTYSPYYQPHQLPTGHTFSQFGQYLANGGSLAPSSAFISSTPPAASPQYYGQQIPRYVLRQDYAQPYQAAGTRAAPYYAATNQGATYQATPYQATPYQAALYPAAPYQAALNPTATRPAAQPQATPRILRPMAEVFTPSGEVTRQEPSRRERRNAIDHGGSRGPSGRRDSGQVESAGAPRSDLLNAMIAARGDETGSRGEGGGVLQQWSEMQAQERQGDVTMRDEDDKADEDMEETLQEGDIME